MKVLIVFLIVLFLCPLVLAKDKESFNPQKYYFNFKDKSVSYDERLDMYYHYLSSKKWNEMREEVELDVWR